MSEIALLLDEIRGMKRRLQALETVQEHPGFAASDVARLSIANTFADDNTFQADVTVEGDLTVDLDANITGDVLATGIVQAAAAWIPGVAVSLDAKLHCVFYGDEPYETDYTGNSHGHRGQASTESGGVIYRPGKFGKAVQIAEATTNILFNPTFESAPGTFLNAGYTFWGSSTGTDGGKDSRFAGCVLRWTKGSTTAEMFGPVFPDYTSGVSYTFSFWARSNASRNFTFRIKNNGSPYDSAVTSSTLTATTEWQRFTATLTMTSGLGSTYRPFVVMSGGTSGVDWIEIAEFQVEQKSYATPLCAGHLGSGHSWSGTAHASTSSRTAASLSYSTPTNIQPAGTMATWIKVASSSGGNQVICDFRDATHTTAAVLYFASLVPTWFFDHGDRIVASSGAISANTWVHIAVTYDLAVNSHSLYVNGVSVGTSSFADSGWSIGSSLWFGRRYTAAQWVNGYIDDVLILSRAATADEIRAIYESNAQLICS